MFKTKLTFEIEITGAFIQKFKEISLPYDFDKEMQDWIKSELDTIKSKVPFGCADGLQVYTFESKLKE